MSKDFIIKDDIVISNGDFLIDESDQQHVEHILKASKGNYFQYPTLGVGIEDKLGGDISPQALEKEIKKQLQSDNYKTEGTKVSLVEKKLFVEIAAERIK